MTWYHLNVLFCVTMIAVAVSSQDKLLSAAAMAMMMVSRLTYPKGKIKDWINAL